MNNECLLMDIDLNRMWVTLTITKPEFPEDLEGLSEDYLEDFLMDEGICNGFLYDNIKRLVEMAENGEYDVELKVAEGRAPVPGEDGRFEYKVAIEDDRAKPKINEDGTVDYHNSLSISMVSNGQEFAVYHPPTMGQFGSTVYSEMISPTKGKELRALRGKGFRIEENSDDTISYIATLDGRIAMDGDRVIIEPIYVVSGNLDIKEGNIHFNGDVEVRGDVSSGMTIETTGNVFVSGHVGASTIMAGKNVTIRRGLQGKGRAKIVAGGDIACSFIEQSEVTSEGSIHAESIMQSEIIARNEVVVQGKKGVIIGGTVTATLGIKAKTFGNDANENTMLQIGVPRGYLDRVAQLRGDERKIRKDIDLLEQKLREMEMMPEGMKSEATEAMRMKCLRAKVVKSTEMKDIQEELAEREQEMENSKRTASVQATGMIYPGVVVNIWREAMAIKQETVSAKFTLSSKGVRMEGI